jgi:hypothetical protein
MPRVGFEPTILVFEQTKTVHASEGAATVDCGLMSRCFVGETGENHENESGYPTFWPRPEAGTSPLRSKSATNLIVTMYRYECHATGGNTTSALLAENILIGTFFQNLSL